MATRRPLTTAIIGHGCFPSSFRYINHLKSFRIPHSTLAASSGPSVPLGADRAVNIQMVIRSVLPKRYGDSLLRSGEPTRWMNDLMQSSATRLTSISTYYEKSPAKSCTVKPTASICRFRYHYEAPAAWRLRRQLKRVWWGSGRQLKRLSRGLEGQLKRLCRGLGRQLKRLCTKVVEFLQRRLLPWVWKTAVKILEDVLVSYLSNNFGGAVWDKVWRALKAWMNW